MSIPDISKFNDDELVTFLNSFDTILTDCDGVIWILGTPYEGASDAIAAFEALGKRVFYVTNNATRPVDNYVKAMTALGYNVTKSQVVNPAVTVEHMLRTRGVDSKVHLLASEAFRSHMKEAGVRVTEPREPSALTLDAVKQHLRALDKDVGAVVVDFSMTLNYVQLMEVSLLLERPDCLFIAGATDHDLPVEPDITLIGPGYIVDMLSQFTRRQPLMAAKPSRAVHEVVAARCPQMDPKRTLFIGDSLPQDMGQGALSGFSTLLVLTGVTSREEAENAAPELRPQFIAPSLKSLVPALRRVSLAPGLQSNK
ncbi:hypothetical protein R5R35_000161 [Gryllus longicercus]|uniref:4-nitrophenylphosphatase n=1 Tax=Gryllus longicercus TaxID=2509291 RepID=A0AAN9V515_9ORTH